MPEFVKRFTYVYLVWVWYLRNVTLPRNFCAVNIDEDKESKPCYMTVTQKTILIVFLIF